MKRTPARRVGSFDDLEEAGDYCLADVEVKGETRRHVWFLLPVHEGTDKFDRPTRGSGVHGVSEPTWTIREFPDGSIEIRASIACGRHDPGGEYWHGYLDRGNVWRQL